MRLGAADESASWFHFALCVGSLVALLSLFFVPAVAPTLLHAEYWAADWRTAFLSERLPSVHPRVAIIAIDEASLAGLPYILPVNRGYLADLVSAAAETSALAIGLDLYFTRDTEKPYDAKLLDALQRIKDKVVLGAFEDARKPAQLAYQLDFIAKSGARAGYIDLQPDPDSVLRHRTLAPREAQYTESFSSVLARAAGWSGRTPPYRIAWLLPPRDGGKTFYEIPAHAFLEVPAEQRAAMFKGQVVIIGDKLFSLDQHSTPLTLRTWTWISGVDVHAQMTAELVDGHRSYAELDANWMRIFVTVLGCLGILLGARFQRRGFDFLNWRVASLVVIALDLILFRYWHLMLPFTLATVAWIAGVTLGSQLRRAFAWSRSRWRTAA
jgi:CHASE2 domain-containing sensor protein